MSVSVEDQFVDKEDDSSKTSENSQGYRSIKQH